MTGNVLPIEIGDDLGERCLRLYEKGLPAGDSTGWPTVDRHYTVAPQQWTLITGTPGSGKSEWLDALMVNLAENARWHFALYSPENHPTEIHLAKLAEKRVRKPFGAGPTTRMTPEELRKAIDWVTAHFYWLKPEYPTCAELFEAANYFREPSRKLGVVFDPWNTLEHLRPREQTETEYISSTLTEITNWCRRSRLHTFIVAHPAKLQRNKDGSRPVPTPYDVAGSAHWYAKADNIICINRDQLDNGQDVEVHIQKIRFKHIGRLGSVDLKYDRVVGRYFEAPWARRGENCADPERAA